MRAAYQSLGGNVAADEDFIADVIKARDYGMLDADKELAEKLGVSLAEWKRAAVDGNRNDPELLAYIAGLRSKYKTALLSNAGAHALQTFFTSAELTQYFDVAVASGDLGFAKPDPQIFRYVAERLGVAPETCVMIDDQPDNCEGAQIAGMHAVQFMTFEQTTQAITELLKAE